jgi:hypothetical protein
VRLGEHTYTGQVDTFSHEQAEAGHKELPDLAFSGVRAGEVDSEPLGSEPPSVGEGHLSIQFGSVFGHSASVAERQGTRQAVFFTLRQRPAALRLDDGAWANRGKWSKNRGFSGLRDNANVEAATV